MNQFSAVVAESAAVAAPSRSPLLRAYEWLAHRELLACAAVLFLSLGIRAALLPWYPQPLPTIHDEFSYLLAGDTYASGRLANPPHPMWRHFDTMHELMQPVYSSIYPAAQGMVLAFGQKVFSNPWIGVYLSTGLMCAVVCWMLQGWVSANLAFLGGILFVLHLGVFDYWMNSYWGGSMAAIGGALALGALIRIWRRGQAWHLITFAVGLSILMHSRPWEGAVLALEMTGVLVWAWRRFPAELRSGSRRAAIPALLILMASLGAVAYQNHRVTGNVLRLPHSLYDSQHILAPVFVFLPLRSDPNVPREGMDSRRGAWETGLWQRARSQPVDALLGKASDLYNFFFGLWPLLIPPLIWPYRHKTSEERVTVVLLAGFLLIAIAPVIVTLPHYAAPIAALLYARFLQTLSRLNDWRPAGKPLGFAVGVFFVTLFVYQFGINLALAVHGGFASSPFAETRATIARELAQMPGRQLVLVHYGPDQTPFEEWVWNRADIDASQTVWAHQMDPAQDAELLRYYPGRTAWLLDVDKQPLQLVPYTAAR